MCKVKFSNYFSSVQSLSHVWLFTTPWTAARQAFLSLTNSRSLLKFMSIASVMPSDHLILCHALILPPSIFPRIRVFSNELVLHIRWPKYWSFSFSISPSNEYSGLISFRTDWLDLLAVQGTLKSLPQHHSSKASILWCSAFFIVQQLTIYYLLKRCHVSGTAPAEIIVCSSPKNNGNNWWRSNWLKKEWSNRTSVASKSLWKVRKFFFLYNHRNLEQSKMHNNKLCNRKVFSH